MKEALNKVPSLEKGNYVIHVCLDEKFKDNVAYTNVVISMILEKTPGKDINLEFSFDYDKNEQSLRIYKKIK